MVEAGPAGPLNSINKVTTRRTLKTILNVPLTAGSIPSEFQKTSAVTLNSFPAYAELAEAYGDIRVREIRVLCTGLKYPTQVNTSNITVLGCFLPDIGATTFTAAEILERSNARIFPAFSLSYQARYLARFVPILNTGNSGAFAQLTPWMDTKTSGGYLLQGYGVAIKLSSDPATVPPAGSFSLQLVLEADVELSIAG
jgi:hypothetical protein